MPLYDYECPSCKHKFEDIAKIKDRNNITCPICCTPAKLLMSAWKDDWFKPFTSEDFNGTPILVKSKQHYKDLCKQHGVYSRALGYGRNLTEI